MRSGDISKVFTLGNTTDVVLPVALILSRAAKFRFEEFTTSSTVLT